MNQTKAWFVKASDYSIVIHNAEDEEQAKIKFLEHYDHAFGLALAKCQIEVISIEEYNLKNLLG